MNDVVYTRKDLEQLLRNLNHFEYRAGVTASPDSHHQAETIGELARVYGTDPETNKGYLLEKLEHIARRGAIRWAFSLDNENLGRLARFKTDY